MPRHGRPGAPGLGAEVTGVDLRWIDEAEFSRHPSRLDRSSGFVSRPAVDRSGSDRIFSRRFGEIGSCPDPENGQRIANGLPEIYVVSNVIENGVAIGSLGYGEAVWHTDMSYLTMRRRRRACCTRWKSLLPVAIHRSSTCMRRSRRCRNRSRQRAGMGLRVKHDGTYNSGGYVRQGVTPTDDHQAPGTLHPLKQYVLVIYLFVQFRYLF